ncbi:CSMD [Mytilus edulis]|uniref:CSMD n=1 Tax=Mytilus edulis TaxID=6550 RepID=A0A8S3SZV2_MYTED|nr:CSMD [Mytilus edulis]
MRHSSLVSIADFNSSEGPWCYIDNENLYWDYCNVPVCESAKCPDLIVNPNLKSLDGKTTYRYGEIVILTCNTGYRLSGSWSLTCQQTGQWNNTIPQCQDSHKEVNSSSFFFLFPPTVVTCHDLRQVPHQKLEPVQIAYSYRDNVTFKCDNGYELSSADTMVTCQSDGTWNSHKEVNSSSFFLFPPTVVTCHDLRQVPHQKLEPVQIAYSYRDNVTFKCDNGYELSSTDTMVTCQSDGTWSNKQPNCTGIYGLLVQ